jgi:hypothetical protein
MNLRDREPRDAFARRPAANTNGFIAEITDEAVSFSEIFPSNFAPYTLNELPQPQVDFTFGFSNLKPAPSSVST